MFEDQRQAAEWVIGRIQPEQLIVVGKERNDRGGTGIAWRRAQIIKHESAEWTVTGQ